MKPPAGKFEGGPSIAPSPAHRTKVDSNRPPCPKPNLCLKRVELIGPARALAAQNVGPAALSPRKPGVVGATGSQSRPAAKASAQPIAATVKVPSDNRAARHIGVFARG